MIKVIKEKEVPRADITCINCGSVLEYGNADLVRDYSKDYNASWYAGNYAYKLRCPVCGVEISASWINKKG